jgi:hypothetical protein
VSEPRGKSCLTPRGACGYCRRPQFLSFAEAWRRADGLARRPRAGEMDARLHAERVDKRSRRQLTRPAPAGQLPAGTMVRYRGEPGLLAGGQLLPWSFAGYLPRSRCRRPCRWRC